MEIKTDPYQVAEDINDIAKDLISDITSLTVHDVVSTLREAAQFIVDFADEHYSYVSKTQVTLTIAGQTMDLTEDILPMVSSAMLQDWIKDAINTYLRSPNVSLLPHDHHGHTH